MSLDISKIPLDVISRSLEVAQSMRSFRSWLDTGSGMFWVCGKPGSGKSTLMKYLVSQFSKEKRLLSFPGASSIVLHHFFWISGDLMQRNFAGCLRSLFAQLIQDEQSAACAVQSTGPTHFGPWTKDRLLSALETTLQKLARPVLILIDGLDECEDSHACLKLLQILARKSYVKVCVSCRPEQQFVWELKSAASLRMQDVNSHDIKAVIEADFLRSSQVSRVLSNSPEATTKQSIEQLAQILHRKAEGVFLWVHYVVKNVLRGIDNHDSVSTLLQRVEKLPENVRDLFSNMLRRKEDDLTLYKSEASLYLSMALHRPLNLQDFCFIADQELRSRYLCCTQYDSLKPQELDPFKVSSWVESRTVGLLELTYIGRDKIRPSPSTLNMTDFGVQLIHRCVRDFLEDSAEGRQLVSSSSVEDDRVSMLCTELRIISEIVLPCLHKESYCSWNPDNVLICSHCSDRVLAPQLPTIERIHQFYWNKRTTALLANMRDGPTFDGPVFVMDESHNLMASLLLRSKRESLTRHFLAEKNYWQDIPRLSSLVGLLAGLAAFEAAYDVSEGAVFNKKRLLEDFFLAGVRADSEIQLPNGEKVCPMIYIAHDVSGRSSGRIRSFYDGLHLNWPVTCQARCFVYHLVWFVFRQRGKFEHCQLWGDFCAAELVHRKFGVNEQGFPLVTQFESRKSVVKVIAMIADGATPILRVVNIFDSPLLLEISRTLRRSQLPPPGVLDLQISHLGKYYQKFHEILDRSPTLSFSAAMSLLGKPHKVICEVYNDIAVMMQQQSFEHQNGWEEWFWGSEKSLITPVVEDAIMLEDQCN